MGMAVQIISVVVGVVGIGVLMAFLLLAYTLDDITGIDLSEEEESEGGK